VNEPQVIDETGEWIAVYKPPLVHSAPLRAGEGGTLVDWCARRYPELRALRGRKGAVLSRVTPPWLFPALLGKRPCPECLPPPRRREAAPRLSKAPSGLGARAAGKYGPCSPGLEWAVCTGR
jgi:hypothetical protein